MVGLNQQALSQWKISILIASTYRDKMIKFCWVVGWRAVKSDALEMQDEEKDNQNRKKKKSQLEEKGNSSS